MKKEIQSYNEFKEEIANGEVLVDFYATWCGPCKMIAPIVGQIAEEYADLKVLSVDVDEIQQAAAEYGVNSIPTLLYIKDGQLVDTHVGYAPKPALLRLVRRG